MNGSFKEPANRELPVLGPSIELNVEEFCLNVNDGEEIVRITREGRVIVNPKYQVEEAAQRFWDAVRNLGVR